jgi:hypothetical protein
MKYLTGFIDEATFRAETRVPSHYDRDYRPVIEFAREKHLVVLAANAPRPLASQVAREGVASVAGNTHVARETTAPEDDYWESFVEKMKEHPGTAPEKLKNYYAAQCLKDDTMAESITDYLRERQRDGQRPLCVLVCGREHSDHGRGTVMRIRSRMPDLDIRVLSAETVKDVASGIYASPRGVGDFVVVSPEVPREPISLAAIAAAPAEPATPAPAPVPAPATAAAPAPSQPPASTPETNPPGTRPALGFRPEYEAGNEGVTVGELRPNGPAEKAGMESGDVITMLNGVKVVDAESYAEVLDSLIIGKTVTVRVRRDNAEVDLHVQVGARSR